MKRRALALLCAGILAVGMLAGCGGSSDKKDSSAKTEDTKKEAKSDGTFTFALNYMPNSLQPSAQSSDDLVSAIRPIYEPLFAETKDGLEYYLADKLDISELWNTIQDKALEECWEYPLTYTNFVMVSQKNVTGLDGSSVVPEFIDYLSIHVD